MIVQRLLMRAIVILAISGIGAVAVRSGVFRVPIQFYDELNERALIVRTLAGPVAWTIVTDVVESAGAVTVTVSSIAVPWPGDEVEEYLPVGLDAPLGDRVVVDATTGRKLPQVDLEIEDVPPG